jgi:hypothetical protein
VRQALGNVLARLLDVRSSDRTASLVRLADRIEVTDEDVLIDSLPDALGWRPRWRTIQERRAIDGRNDDGSTRYAVTPAHRISVEEAEEELAECGVAHRVAHGRERAAIVVRAMLSRFAGARRSCAASGAFAANASTMDTSLPRHAS